MFTRKKMYHNRGEPDIGRKKMVVIPSYDYDVAVTIRNTEMLQRTTAEKIWGQNLSVTKCFVEIHAFHGVERTSDAGLNLPLEVFKRACLAFNLSIKEETPSYSCTSIPFTLEVKTYLVWLELLLRQAELKPIFVDLIEQTKRLTRFDGKRRGRTRLLSSSESVSNTPSDLRLEDACKESPNLISIPFSEGATPEECREFDRDDVFVIYTNVGNFLVLVTSDPDDTLCRIDCEGLRGFLLNTPENRMFIPL